MKIDPQVAVVLGQGNFDPAKNIRVFLVEGSLPLTVVVGVGGLSVGVVGDHLINQRSCRTSGGDGGGGITSGESAVILNRRIG